MTVSSSLTRASDEERDHRYCTVNSPHTHNTPIQNPTAKLVKIGQRTGPADAEDDCPMT